jgi:hypothetical protein
MERLLKIWFKGRPITGIIASGKNVGQMSFWFHGLPVPGGQVSSPFPPPPLLFVIQSQVASIKAAERRLSIDFTSGLIFLPIAASTRPAFFFANV